jgi:hypothetical protein
VSNLPNGCPTSAQPQNGYIPFYGPPN